MLTIEDLRAPDNASGFRNVGFNQGKTPVPKPYQAFDGREGGPSRKHRWKGPRRATAEEAAQDYCDYMNKPLTIEDIRNPDRKSGFNYVRFASDHKRQTRNNPYQAQSGGQHPKQRAEGTAWKGPRRSTPEEAAQDYCDHINSQRVEQPARLNSAGHERPVIEPVERDPEEEAAWGVIRDKKAQREGRQGYVYCIGEGQGGTPGYGVKIGYSVNPPKRVIELQTGNPRVLHLLGTVEGTEADERRLHAKYINYNLIGEWFVPTPELLGEFGLTTSGQPKEIAA